VAAKETEILDLAETDGMAAVTGWLDAQEPGLDAGAQGTTPPMGPRLGHADDERAQGRA
jgi:hypothetical protein